MPTLIEIGEEFRHLADLLTEADGELTEKAEKQFDELFAGLVHDRDNKLNAYCAIIRELELQESIRRAEADQIKAEAARRAKSVQVRENAVERLKNRMLLFFQQQGLKKVETGRHTLNRCKNSGLQGVEVNVRAEELPAEFQLVEIKADTEKLRKALLAGLSLDCVRLVPRGEHLRIS